MIKSVHSPSVARVPKLGISLFLILNAPFAIAHGQQILLPMGGTLILWILGVVIVASRKTGLRSWGAVLGYISATILTIYCLKEISSDFIFFGIIWLSFFVFGFIFWRIAGKSN